MKNSFAIFINNHNNNILSFLHILSDLVDSLKYLLVNADRNTYSDNIHLNLQNMRVFQAKRDMVKEVLGEESYSLVLMEVQRVFVGDLHRLQNGAITLL